MNNEYRLNQQSNCECQCQCHYPSSMTCPITRCCHCFPNNFSPISSMSSFYKSGKGQNNLMNSCSTNFISNNDESIGLQNSGYDFKRNYNIRKTRNNQNQLGRNFSETNINLYNNYNNDNQNMFINNTFNLDERNIIQHEPFINRSSNNNDNNCSSYDNNNISLVINNQSSSNNQKQSSSNNQKKDNLTYNYYESQNKNDFNSDNNIISNNKQNNIKNFPKLS